GLAWRLFCEGWCIEVSPRFSAHRIAFDGELRCVMPGGNPSHVSCHVRPLLWSRPLPSAGLFPDAIQAVEHDIMCLEPLGNGADRLRRAEVFRIPYVPVLVNAFSWNRQVSPRDTDLLRIVAGI